MYSGSRNKKSSSRRFFWIFAAVVAVWVALAVLGVGTPPAVEIQPRLDGIGPATEVDLTAYATGRGLVDLRVELVQQDQVWSLAEKTYPHRAFWQFWGDRIESDRLTVTVGRNAQPELKPGEATIRVSASRAGTPLLNPGPEIFEKVLPVRLDPPDLSVVEAPTRLRQGGSGAVVYRVGADAARHGLKIRDQEVSGSARADGNLVVLFGAPFDMEDAGESLRLFAEDELGNRIEQNFVTNYSLRPEKTDDIRLSDGFFEDVVPEILSHTPDIQDQGGLLPTYLMINNQLRRQNAQTLVELAARSADQVLWQGRFSQLPNSRVMAGFAERRSYMYGGEKVDEQTHLGFDLASRKQAEVPSANGGKVVLAKYFGIYGKTVVVDHGLGLMSLYSHLSDISVSEGEDVEAGKTLGRTGATGLAGGDHLHFTMLIHGVQVDPLEWWDPRWIKTHISPRLSPPQS